MFAVQSRMEVMIRVLLCAAILFSAVLPTTALAKSEKTPAAELTNDADLNAPRSLPSQESLYFDSPHITYPQQTSPDPDKPKSPIPPKDEVEFTLVADPAIIPADGLVKLTVFIRNNSDRELAGLVFADNLESGLSYSKDNNSPVVFDQKTNKVSLEIDPLNPGDEYTFSYSVILTSTKKNAVKGKIWLHGAELKTIDNLVNLKADVALGFDLQSMTSESELAVLQSNGGWNRLGRVAVHMEKDSVEANALVVSSPAKVSGKGPELQFNLDVIETNPVTVDSKGKHNEQAVSVKKENKNSFKKPAFLEINLDDYVDLKNIPAGQEPYVATYDEINKIWVKVPIIAQDYEGNTVTVEAAHFSTWGAGLGSSLPQNGANVLLFDQPYTSLFTGSSRYSIPVWTPPGRAGMQPDVSLSYSSGTVDGVLGDVQAPWVGVGWNIDAVEIVRKITTDENGYGYRNDFALTLNGSLYQLIRDENSQNRYYTDQAAFLYVERHNYAFSNNPSTVNKTGEWWEVVTTDGTRYRLGWNEKSEQLALMYGYSCTTNGLSCITPNGAYASLGYAGRARDLVAMRWRVDRVSDTHGNYIEYDYMETQPSDATTIAPFDRESYLESISYTGFEDPDGVASPIAPAYQVKFIYEPRSTVGDVPTEFNIWDNIDYKLLDNIQICYGTCGETDSTTIRTYQFNYTLADVPNANGTLTLTSLEIAGGGYTEDGQSIPVTEAPTIKFTYQNLDNRAVSGSADKYTYPRLKTIHNGSGGKLIFSYDDDNRGTNSWYNYSVKDVVVDSGMGIVKKQSYTYETPVYSGSGSDPDLGSLTGYTTVTESLLDFNNADAQILDTKHTFGTVGLDIGRELQTQLLIGGTTTVLRKTTNIYVTDNSQAPFAGWNYRYLGESASYVRSGSALTLTSKSSYYHDPATGNLLVQSNYLGNSLYRKTYYEYLTNLDPAYYILDKVSRVLLVNAGNQIYSDTRYHYDDTLNEAPIRGDVTLVQKLTGNSSETVDVSTHYDVYGNADWTRAYKSYGSANSFPSSAYVESVSTYDETLRTYPVSATDAMGNVSTSDYLYTLGVPYQTTDPNVWTTTSTYDGLGRTLSVTPPGLDQAGTVYIYPTPNASGNIPAPHSVEMQILDTIAGKYRSVWGIYDGAGRMLQTQVDASTSAPPVSDKLLVNTTLFNAQGLAIQQSLPYEVNGAGGNYTYNAGSQFTTTEYDALGRVTKITAPGNIVSQTSYDGLITTSLDPNGNKVSRTTDGFGRMTAVTEFSGDQTVYATTNYFYDAADRLIQVKDAQFNTTLIQYDWLGRKLGMDDPDMGVWSYGYDSLGNMSSQMDARGEQLLFAYDDLNRLILKQDDDPNTQDITSYTYGTQSGEIGLRVGMSDPSGSTTWNYGPFARTVTESRTIGGEPQSLTTHTDWLGRAISTSYEDGEVVSYEYDDLGRPKILKSEQNNQENNLVDLAYNSLGQIYTQTLGNGTVITNTYDSVTTRLNNRSAVNGGTLFDLSYQYDLNGNITRLTDNQLGETHFYQYDFLNRLTSAIAGNGTLTAPPATPQGYGQQYEYDKVGNILQVNEWGSSTQQAHQPELFQPVSYQLPAPANQSGATDTPTVTPVGSFPSTGVLDDFNRANGFIGFNWMGYENPSAFSISSNQLSNSSSGIDSIILWNASFGVNQEAYFTFTELGGTSSWRQDLLLKGNVWGSIDVRYDAANNIVQVWTLDSAQTVQHGADIPVTFSNGDQFGARALSDGTVEVYKNGTLLATRNVSSWSYYNGGGYIGLWFGNVSNAKVDDFGGGNVSSGPSPTPTLTQTPSPVINTPTRTNTPLAATDTPTKTNTPAPDTSTSTPTVTLTTVDPTFTPSVTATRTLVPTNTPPATYTRTITPPPFYVAKNWLFNSTTESWAVTNHISGFVWQTGGYVGGTITGTDPHIVSADNLGVDITNNKLIKIHFKNTTVSTIAQVFFTTNASTTFDAAKHIDFTITANSDYTEYTIDMSSVAGWTGTLKRLRFDPATATGSFSVDYITIGSTYLTPTPIPTSTSTPIPSATQAPPSQQLMAYWDFEGVTGTTVLDVAPSDVTANNATLVNGPVIQNTGAQGSSAFFDGVNDYATVADQTEIKKNGSFTVSAWVNPSTVITNRTQYILNKGVSATDFDYGFITTSTTGTATPTPPANVDVNGKLVFRIGDLTPNKIVGPVLPINTWTMVTAVYIAAAGELRLYINGTLSAVEEVTGTVSMGTGALRFSAPSPNQFAGSLDEVRFYNRALSHSEVADLFGTFGTPTPLPSITPTPTSPATVTPTATALSISEQQWGTGDDGDLSVSGTFNINTQSNRNNGRTCADAVSYTLTSLGSTVAQLSTSPGAGCLNPGDEIMLINLKGTSASAYNTGVYEFLRVSSVSGNSVFFTTMKSKWYGNSFHSDVNIGTGIGKQKVMLIRVPNYDDVTINGTLTTTKWDGNKKGLIVFRVAGTLNGSGTISASGMGYNINGDMGEGYTDANLGGGGKGGAAPYHTGGGGGGYGTAGQNDPDTLNGGKGGVAYGVANLDRFYYGSQGGGAGDKELAGGGMSPGDPGGAGGGGIYIIAKTINFTGALTANGSNPAPSGGAGGSIRIEGETISLNTVTVNGGERGGKGRIAVYYKDSFNGNFTPGYLGMLSDPASPTSTPTATPSAISPWGTGQDGDLTVNGTFNISAHTNGHNGRTCLQGGDAVSYSVVELNTSWAKLSTVPLTGCLFAGDEILLINLKGTSANYTNTGTYEFLRVGGIVGDTVYFKTPKLKFYGDGTNNDANIGTGTGKQKVMMIRVPNYNNVTINGTLTTTKWDGGKKGLIVFRVAGTLTGGNDDIISAAGLGYNLSCCSGEGYTDSGLGGGKKAGTSPYHQSGGGGGYGTAGQAGSDPNTGGISYGVANLDRFYYGSQGGAAGDKELADGGVSAGDPGGAGGGGIYIIAKTINFTGTLTANGSNPAPSGGAGGSIRIEGETIALGTVLVNGGTRGGLGRIAIYYSNSLANSATICAQASTYCKNTGQVSTATPTPTATPYSNPGTTGLVSWWTMNETSGTRQDSYGTNHLIDNNTVGSATGLKGNAASFVTANQERLTISDNPSISTGDIDFTLIANVYLNNTSNTFVLVDKSDHVSAYDYRLAYNPGTGFRFRTGNDLAYVNSGEVLPNTWYTVIAWHDSVNNTINIQVNNGPVNSASYSSGTVDTTASLSIGAYPDATLPLDGRIDEVALYKRVLTAGERNWLYNAGAGRTYSDVNPSVPQGWNASSYAYEGDQPHAVTSLSGGNTYTYDENGNMTCRVEDGVTYLQTYSAENRIASIQKLASGDCAAPLTLTGKWDFAYDGDGVRTSQLYTTYDENGEIENAVVTRYYFGGALETSGSSVKKYYSFGGGMVAMKDNGVFKYFLSDHLGSVSLVLDDQGGILEGQRYLPFGEPRTMAPYADVTSTDFTYTGQRALPNTGLMDYRARFYSPSLKRFIQPDSIIPGVVYSQTWNRYSYVLNNPINASDPSGHKCVGNADECLGADGKKGGGFTGNGPVKKPKNVGCGNQGQKRCNGKPPTYGDGLIGPPAPPYETYHTSFQMFPEIPNSGDGGYTDFSSGGNPEYVPAIYTAPVNDHPTVVNQASGWADLGISLLTNILPVYYQHKLPYDQNVYMNYTTAYNNIPSRNATSTVTLTSLSIVNSSTTIDSVISYSVSITSVDRSKSVQSEGSAAPGKLAEIPIPSGLNINNIGGFNIFIRATTSCANACVTIQNPLSFQGAINFNFNP